MAAIRYIFLSDLHFGERNGILTDPVGPETDAPLEPNQALAGLVACLEDVARECRDGVRPRLVLLGDVFELALAPRHTAFELFARFVGALFPEGREPLFEPRLVFVPGNHDHDLWTSTRDDLMNLQLERQQGRLGPTPPVTPIFDLLCPRTDGTEPIRSAMLTRLLRRRLPHRGDLEVQVTYPNLGILRGERALVAHHGHFMDDVYLLMSILTREVFGEVSVATLAQLEEDNGAWLDFLWSSLGREGAIAGGLRRSYDLLQSDSGKILLASRFSAALGRRGWTRFGQRLRQRLLLSVLLRVLDRIAHTDVRRTLPATEKVPDEVLGYVEGPLATAVWEELEARGSAPSRFAYVYGHTHRPLAQMAALPRRGTRVAVYNTGGWVVDTHLPRPATSGGMLLVDENLDTVLVRMGAQVQDPHLEPAQVWHAGEDGRSLALHRDVEALISRAGGPWQRTAVELGSAVLRRRSEHITRLFKEIEQLTAFERMALRSEYLWKLLSRRRAQAQAQLRALLAESGGEVLRTPRVVREKSPIGLLAEAGHP